MNLRFLIEGQEFTLYAIMQGEDVADYLAKLELKNVQAHDQIVRRLEQLAERGPSRKRDEFNLLGHDLYEVKAKSGPRVIFFYDQDHIVICSHAFNKQSQKTPSKEIKKAREWKRKYFERKASGQGFVIYMEKEQAAPRRQP